ncbi:hypothetical protein, partial [Escherichia coli]|uniref:hypothetical protein n=1 Tax=Escherichia coli TaxID=562 RepID=UPI003EE21D05
PAIGFVCSEYRTGQNDTFSLPQWSVLYRDFCSPIHYSDYRVSMLGQQEHLNRNLINHENTSLIEEKNIN